MAYLGVRGAKVNFKGFLLTSKPSVFKHSILNDLFIRHYMMV